MVHITKEKAFWMDTALPEIEIEIQKAFDTIGIWLIFVEGKLALVFRGAVRYFVLHERKSYQAPNPGQSNSVPQF